MYSKILQKMANSITSVAKNILLATVSILIGLVLFEIIASLVIGKELSNDHQRSRRYLLYGTADGTPVFRNQGKIFTYSPNSTIRTSAYYENGDAIAKEYDYQFKTNNFGLVQKLDIDKERPSVLVLGDSFAEGQGAIPWFYKLEEDSRKDIQLINGGLW